MSACQEWRLKTVDIRRMNQCVQCVCVQVMTVASCLAWSSKSMKTQSDFLECVPFSFVSFFLCLFPFLKKKVRHKPHDRKLLQPSNVFWVFLQPCVEKVKAKQNLIRWRCFSLVNVIRKSLSNVISGGLYFLSGFGWDYLIIIMSCCFSRNPDLSPHPGVMSTLTT